MPRLLPLNLAEWTQVASNIAVIISVLIVVPIYLFQRSDQNALHRRELTEQLFLRKYEDTIAPAYWKVSRAFDSGNKLFKVIQGSQDTEARKAAVAYIRDQAGLENIGIMVSYFEELVSCANKNQCDAELARELLEPDLTPFYCKAQLVGLPELRKEYNYPGYAADLAKYAGPCPSSAKP